MHPHAAERGRTPGPEAGIAVFMAHSSDLLDGGLAAGLAAGRSLRRLPRQ